MSTLKVNSIQTAGGASPVLVTDIAKKSDLAASGGAALVGFQPIGAGATLGTIGDKLYDGVSVRPEDFGADPTGATSSTVAFNAMFASGAKRFKAKKGATYKLKGVVLPSDCNGVEFDGAWATYIPDTAAANCFTHEVTANTRGMELKNFTLTGDVANFINISITSVGVIVGAEIHHIYCASGTGSSLVKISNTTAAQSENIKVNNLDLQGAASYDHAAWFTATTTGFGSLDIGTIFHNGSVGVSTVQFDCAVLTSKFDLIYNTRGNAIKCLSPYQATHCTFTRCETEAVVNNTIIYYGNFVNCSFDQSWVYSINPALSGGRINVGTFRDCEFKRNYVYMGTTGTGGIGSAKVMSFDGTSQFNVIYDLLDAVGGSYRYWSGIENLGSLNTYGVDSVIKGGDAGGQSILRRGYITIANGTVGVSVQLSLDSKWNGQTVNPVDNITKGSTSGVWSLSANGSVVTLSGQSVITSLSAMTSYNLSGMDMAISDDVSSGSLALTFLNRTNGGPQDLTTYVDTGLIRIELLYITAI